MKEWKACFYCGKLATCEDHVLPVSAWETAKELKHLKFLVPSCKSCNSRAGDRVFLSVEDKKLWITTNDKTVFVYNIRTGICEYCKGMINTKFKKKRRFCSESCKNEMRKKVILDMRSVQL